MVAAHQLSKLSELTQREVCPDLMTNPVIAFQYSFLILTYSWFRAS